MTVGQLRAPLAVSMELSWSYAALALFVALATGANGRGPSLIAVGVVVAGSFALARLLQSIDIDERDMRLIGVASSVIAVVLVAQLDYGGGRWWDVSWLRQLVADPGSSVADDGHVVAGVIGLAALWLRGIVRGQAEIEFPSVLGSATAGLFAVALAAIAGPEAGWPESFGVLAIAYAVLALAALALYQTPDGDVPLSSFAGRWATTIGIVLGVTAAVTLTALAVDPDAFGVLAPAQRPLGAAGDAALTYVFGPIFFVVSLPFQGIAWLLDRAFDPQSIELQRPAGTELPEETQDQGEQPWWFRVLIYAGIALAGVLLLAIVLVTLWFAFRRFARRPRDARERRESVEAASTLGDDMAALFGALRGRLRRRTAATRRVPVQRLYFEIVERAADAGVERPPPRTPLQFAPDLDAHFNSDAPSAITEAFGESRYGERDLDDARVRELRERWESRRG